MSVPIQSVVSVSTKVNLQSQNPMVARFTVEGDIYYFVHLGHVF